MNLDAGRGWIEWSGTEFLESFCRRGRDQVRRESGSHVTCMGLFLSSGGFWFLPVLCSEVCPGKAKYNDPASGSTAMGGK
jgi:hypothetical protein